MSTSWLIVTNSLLPRLIGSRILLRRIACVPLRQSSMYMKLLVCRVNTRRRRVEVPLHAEVLGGQQQVRVDQHREHAERFVTFDETHPPHVGGQVIDALGAPQRLLALSAPLQLQAQVLCFGE